MISRTTETFRTSYKALNANKVRSFLTMLGVIIGVFSVVTLIALGKGIENYITDEFDSLGSNLLFISPGRFNVAGDPATQFTGNELDDKHIDLIKNYAGEYVSEVTPLHTIGEVAKYKTNSYSAEVIGTIHNSTDIFNYVLGTGRSFTKSEERNADHVAILGPVIERELFGAQNPLGQQIHIGNDTYEVIGVFEEKGSNYDEQIIVPYTALEDSFDLKNYSSIVAKVSSPDKVNLAKKQIEIALLRDLDEEEFTVLSQEDALGSIKQILGVLTLGLGAIAGISLVVGGIGIMNIMLVSVTERIKEVGLRKALGATPFDIGLQFLVESVLLSIGGGTIGLMLGYLASLGARGFIRTEIPLYAVVLAFGFSAIVGMVFGTYPAYNASKKDPIDALRYE